MPSRSFTHDVHASHSQRPQLNSAVCTQPRAHTHATWCQRDPSRVRCAQLAKMRWHDEPRHGVHTKQARKGSRAARVSGGGTYSTTTGRCWAVAAARCSRYKFDSTGSCTHPCPRTCTSPCTPSLHELLVLTARSAVGTKVRRAQSSSL